MIFLWFWCNSSSNADAMVLASARLRGIHPPDNIQNGGCPGGIPLMIKRALARTMASAFWWWIMAWQRLLESTFCVPYSVALARPMASAFWWHIMAWWPGCIPCKLYAGDTPTLTIDSIVICQTHARISSHFCAQNAPWHGGSYAFLAESSSQPSVCLMLCLRWPQGICLEGLNTAIMNWNINLYSVVGSFYVKSRKNLEWHQPISDFN